MYTVGNNNTVCAQSCLTLCDFMDCSLSGSSVHGIFSGKNTGVDCHFLLQGIFPTQGSNLSLLQVSCIAGRFFPTEPPMKPRVGTWVSGC